MVQPQYKFEFRKALYPPLEVGVPQGSSKLDILLKRCEIPFDKFITKCTAVKETLTAKESKKKKCTLILCSDGFVTRGTLN